MIRHTRRHRLRILLVALNHRVKLSQRRQDLGHPVFIGLTDASGRTKRTLTLTLTLIKTEYWDRAGGGGNISYDWRGTSRMIHTLMALDKVKSA